MGLFEKLGKMLYPDLVVKEEDFNYEDLEQPKKANKFIVFSFNLTTTDKQAALELGHWATSVLINSYAYFSKEQKKPVFNKDDFINSSYGESATYSDKNPKFVSQLSKEFSYEVNEFKGYVDIGGERSNVNEYNISIFPIKKNKLDTYSLPNLYNDMFILRGFPFFLKERLEEYGLEFNDNAGNTITLDNNKLSIEFVQNLMRMNYYLEDRIKEEKKMPIISQMIFGESVEDCLLNLKRENENGEGIEKDILREVNKLLKRLKDKK